MRALGKKMWSDVVDFLFTNSIWCDNNYFTSINLVKGFNKIWLKSLAKTEPSLAKPRKVLGSSVFPFLNIGFRKFMSQCERWMCWLKILLTRLRVICSNDSPKARKYSTTNQGAFPGFKSVKCLLYLFWSDSAGVFPFNLWKCVIKYKIVNKWKMKKMKKWKSLSAKSDEIWAR